MSKQEVLPNYSNISIQAVERADEISNILSKSVLGTKKFGERLTIVVENSDAFNKATTNILGALNSISELISIKSLIKLNKGLSILNKIDFDPLIGFLTKFSAITTVTKEVGEDGKGVEKQTADISGILKGIIAITDPKTIMKISLGIKALGKIDKKQWDILRKSINIIINIANNISKEDIEKKEKQIKSLNNIVKGLSLLMVDAMLLSALALPVAAPIKATTKIIKSCVKSILSIVDSIGEDAKNKEKEIAEARKLILSIGATFTLFALTILIVGKNALDPGMWVGLIALAGLVMLSVWIIKTLGSKKLEKQTKEGALVILAIGATFTLFALTILLIGEVATDKGIWAGLLTFAALVGAAIGLLFILSLPVMKNLTKEGGLTLILIGATFSLFALTVLLLGEAVIKGEMLKTMIVFAGVVALAAGVLRVLSSNEKDIIQGAAAMAIMGGALLLLVAVIAALNAININEGMLVKFIILAGVVALATGILSILSRNEKDIIKGAIAMAIMGGALLLFVAVIAAINAIELNEGMGLKFLILAGIIALSAGVVVGLSYLSGNVILGAAAMAIMGGALLVFVGVIAILNSIELNEGVWEKFGLLAAVIGLGAAAVTGLAFISPLIILGSVAMVALGGSLILMAKAIKDTAAAVDNDSITSVYNFLCGGDATKPNLSNIVNSYVNLLSIKDSLKIIIVSKGISKIASSLKDMARALKEISEIKVDVTKVAENTVNVITIVLSSIANLVNTDQNVKEAIAVSGNIFSNRKSTISKVLGLSQEIGNAISLLSEGVANMANLVITEYKPDGSVKSRRQLNDNDFAIAGNNVGKIITNILTSISGLSTDPTISEMISTGIFGGKSEASKVLGLSQEIGNAISAVATGVTDMANMVITEYNPDGTEKGKRQLNDSDFLLASKNIGKIMTYMVTSIGGVTKDKNVAEFLKNKKASKISMILDLSSSIGDTMTKISGVAKNIGDIDVSLISTNMKALFDSTVGLVTGTELATDYSARTGAIRDTANNIDNLVKSVNAIDITKLEKLNSLLSTLHKFTKGVEISFDSLANAINSNLVDVLEDLKETLEKTSGAISGINTNKTNTNSSNSYISNTGTEDTSNDIINQIKSLISNIDRSISSIKKSGESGGIGVQVIQTTKRN